MSLSLIILYNILQGIYVSEMALWFVLNNFGPNLCNGETFAFFNFFGSDPLSSDITT